MNQRRCHLCGKFVAQSDWDSFVIPGGHLSPNDPIYGHKRCLDLRYSPSPTSGHADEAHDEARKDGEK